MLTRFPELEGKLKLNFEPVVCKKPEALTRGQIEQFNADGFIGPLPLLDADALRKAREAFAAEAEAFRESDPDALAMHARRRWVYDIVAHPRTTACLRDLMGSDVVCHISQYIDKPPQQTTGGSYHQDATFNAMDARCVIVWLALDDADEENGCMQFIPGSHRTGVVPCDEKHFVIDPLRYGRTPFPCCAAAGHGVFMSDLLMHSSPPNRSATRRRPAYTATYAPASITPHTLGRGAAALCCGEDRSGKWCAVVPVK